MSEERKKFVNPEKLEAITEFHGLKHDIAGRKIVSLIDILINEARIDNDTAAAESVLWNQGKISAYLLLKSYLDREPTK